MNIVAADLPDLVRSVGAVGGVLRRQADFFRGTVIGEVAFALVAAGFHAARRSRSA
jgi:hypothetical protein